MLFLEHVAWCLQMEANFSGALSNTVGGSKINKSCLKLPLHLLLRSTIHLGGDAKNSKRKGTMITLWQKSLFLEGTYWERAPLLPAIYHRSLAVIILTEASFFSGIDESRTNYNKCVSILPN